MRRGAYLILGGIVGGYLGGALGTLLHIGYGAIVAGGLVGAVWGWRRGRPAPVASSASSAQSLGWDPVARVVGSHRGPCPQCGAWATQLVNERGQTRWVCDRCGVSPLRGFMFVVELAKGFEPPTG